MNNNNNSFDDDFQILSEQNEEDFELVTTLKDKISFITQITANISNTQLAVGTTQGYRIYCLPEFRLVSQREGMKGFKLKTGIKLISILYETRILGLVTNGINQNYPDDEVIIFDDRENKIINRIIIYEAINKLILTTNVLIAVCDKRIVVVDLEKHETIKRIMNCQNTDKFFTTTQLPDKLLIAYCNTQKQIQITNINKNYSFIISSINLPETQSIWLNKDGSQLACVQIAGTSIDVYEIKQQKIMATLYRGRNATKIIYIGFDEKTEEIFLLSERGTMHLYNIGEKQKQFAILPEQLSKIIKGQQLASFFQHKVRFLQTNQLTVQDDSTKKICHHPILIKFNSDKILAIGDNGEYEIIKYNNQGQKEMVVESQTWFDTFLTLRKQLDKIQEIFTKQLKRNYSSIFETIK